MRSLRSERSLVQEEGVARIELKDIPNRHRLVPRQTHIHHNLFRGLVG